MIRRANKEDIKFIMPIYEAAKKKRLYNIYWGVKTSIDIFFEKTQKKLHLHTFYPILKLTTTKT